MCLCKKCGLLSGVIVLALGIAFLLKDLGVWGFWGVNWWTALLLLGGLGALGSHHCPECEKARKKK